MHWIKEVIVDILVTLFIAATLWLGDPWMWWVIAIYTGLLLIAKSMVLSGDGMLSRAQKSQQAPEWFLHVLYALNIILLGAAAWWYVMAAWCIIWILSYLGQRKIAAK